MQRTVTVTVAIAVCILLSGCIGFGGTSDKVSVFIGNKDNTEHQVTVTLKYQNRSLVNESVVVEPETDREFQFQNPDETGEANLSVQTGNQSLEKGISVGSGSGLDSIQIEIDDNGDLTAYTGVR